MSECCVGVGVCCVCLEESDSPRHSLPSLGLSLHNMMLINFRICIPIPVPTNQEHIEVIETRMECGRGVIPNWKAFLFWELRF